MDIVVIGAGSMAIAYAKTLKHLGLSFRCMGRGAESANRFEAETGVAAGTGPLVEQLMKTDVTDALAIVAVDLNQLSTVCASLIDAGVHAILVEKPGGVDLADMQILADLDTRNCIRVAYNRRFFKSTQKALDLIKSDGGAQLIHFEFTELPDRIESMGVHPHEVLANLPYANSSHVFDMAFHLGLASEDLSEVVVSGAVRQGEISWHPDGSRFASCGLVGDQSVFNCFADWRSGGNWNVEITTAERRLRLRPLETLTVQLRESFQVDPVEISADPEGLKPGLPDMVQDFILNGGKKLPSMRHQVERMKVFAKLLSRDH
ncbi:NAD(P)-binding domain-containing protein [uncultured Ruegeria sp.]|uniref:NAD(P)-binding domain-containing protein n=1 Tax=uncultured Ruegeria sp. TaxID=259304 RepID=UPI0026208E8D|nr:NAD(P)-binding domain-containing protein [uncultured Ruegeria sp.]